MYVYNFFKIFTLVTRALCKMIRLVLIVFVYSIIVFAYINASELVNMDTANKDMSVLNTVQPVENVTDIEENSLKVQVIRKLKEVFWSQFPSREFKLRAYDVVNWPPGIDSHESYNWRRDDLIRINERIPFYRFEKREAVPSEYYRKTLLHSLNEMECLKNVILNENCTKKEMMTIISARFKEETGQNSRIDWHLVDRSQIPEKYNNVPLNGATFANKFIFRNPEIIDKIHFKKCGSVRDEEANDVIGAAVNSDELEIDTILSFNELEFDIDSRDLKKLYKTAEESSMNLQPSQRVSRLAEQLKMAKLELKNAFKAQHPDEEFKWRNYEIQNWPEGVGMLPDRWGKEDIRKIRENIHRFVFVKRLEAISRSSQLGIKQLGDLSGILDPSWTKKEVHDFILKRYRKETGYANSQKIIWNFLDRRDIPAKYDTIEINNISMNSLKIYRNPEIISNVHFFNRQGIKRKRK